MTNQMTIQVRIWMTIWMTNQIQVQVPWFGGLYRPTPAAREA